MAGSLLEATSDPADGAAGSGEVRRSFGRDPEAKEATSAVELQFLLAIITREEGEDSESRNSAGRLDSRKQGAWKQEGSKAKLGEESVT